MPTMVVEPTIRMRISSRRVCPLSSACLAAVSTEITISPNMSCRRIEHVKKLLYILDNARNGSCSYNWKLEFRDMLGHGENVSRMVLIPPVLIKCANELIIAKKY